MNDIRPTLAAFKPRLVEALERAIEGAHAGGGAVTLAPNMVVGSRHHPLVVRFKGLDDVAAADALGKWHAFFARAYAAVGAAEDESVWSDVARVRRARPGPPREVMGRVLRDAPSVTFTWGIEAAPTRARDLTTTVTRSDDGGVSVAFTGDVDEAPLRAAVGAVCDAIDAAVGHPGDGDIVAAFTSVAWPSLLRLRWSAVLTPSEEARIRAAAPALQVLRTPADDARDQEERADARRRQRDAGLAAEASATDIGGVEIAGMGAEVDLPASVEVVRSLRRLPPTVRVLRLTGGDLGGQDVARALAAVSLDRLGACGA